MEFKEFLDKEEEELFESNIDQLDEFVGTGLKFLGGLGGNFVSQAARGLGNATVGLGQSMIGTGQGVASALQAASGGLKKGRETIGKATSNWAGGGEKIARGIAQLGGALTGVTPVLRGVQAASAPLRVSGLYAPASKNRSRIQDLFGLDSWEKPDVDQSQRQSSTTKAKPQDPAIDFLKDLEQKQSDPNVPSWEDLVKQYKAARTQPSGVRKAIRAEMRKHHPHRYMQTVEELRKRQKSVKK